ncbi:MAG TPA: ferritin [Thermoleophilaceae bacterium]|jgi:ferritin|nr:ferritin [Thermoleophilaceae bacterium]
MPAQRFVDALTAQIGREFGASQQYTAVAVYYDDLTLPRLASLYYRQALEERTHAMMMVRYLLDSEVRPKIPGLDAPRGDFRDLVEPIRISLEQERKVTESISELASIAREEGDHVSEQFVQWFLKEQVEEVALFSSLLAVAERARDRPMDIEQYIAREGVGAEDPDPTAPPAAGA